MGLVSNEHNLHCLNERLPYLSGKGQEVRGGYLQVQEGEEGQV